MSFISTFELFKVGVGPSSSHTVGPMRAALAFRRELEPSLGAVHTVQIRLFGSLAHTGKGHHTDRAVLWGLCGLEPQAFDATRADEVLARVAAGQLPLSPDHPIAFESARDLVFDRARPVGPHPNELRLEALDAMGELLLEQTWFSVGGGFISRPEDLGAQANPSSGARIPFVYSNGEQLLKLARSERRSIAELVRENELSVRRESEVAQGLERIWTVMSACIDRGLATEGVLPGGLSVQRRAAKLHRALSRATVGMKGRPQPNVSDFVMCWAMAVNEENAAGGEVVTAPTNGAAGVVPAVLRYYFEFVDDGSDPLAQTLETFFFTASAIGTLLKLNASISGAEVGCQGEVGSAASMAAAGLCALLGGTPAQVEQAAEIAIEHNLGLTCDPVGGLVQVPCIERNGFGAVKAISAARLAMHEDGDHRVTLDQVIETMLQTGRDMSEKYKETSLGGLAVRFVEC